MKLEHVDTMNWRGALRGMRNPLESWDKSDTTFDTFVAVDGMSGYHPSGNPTIGENDYKLCTKLIKAGSDHRKFLRQIFISFDLTVNWGVWREFCTYKIGTTENSTSMMHKLGSRLLTQDDFGFDRWDTDNINVLDTINDQIEHYQRIKNGVIQEKYNGELKDEWRRMIHMMPAAFLYKRTCTMNYEVLRNMYNARKNHKQKEWPEFLNELLKQIPYPEFITEK